MRRIYIAILLDAHKMNLDLEYFMTSQYQISISYIVISLLTGSVMWLEICFCLKNWISFNFGNISTLL